MSRDLERKVARLEKLVQAKRRAAGTHDVKFDFYVTTFFDIPEVEVYFKDFDKEYTVIKAGSTFPCEINGTFSAESSDIGIREIFVDDLWDATIVFPKDATVSMRDIKMNATDPSRIRRDVLIDGWSVYHELPFSSHSSLSTNAPTLNLDVPINAYFDTHSFLHFGAVLRLQPTELMQELWRDIFVDFERTLEKEVNLILRRNPTVDKDTVYQQVSDDLYEAILDRYR